LPRFRLAEGQAMKVSGKIVGANIDFRTGKPTISFEVNERNDFGLLVDEMKGLEKLSIEVKPFRQRRSLDANAYCWVLIDKLAEKIGESKETIYRQYITNIGGNSEIVCAKNEAVDMLRAGWHRNGLGWQTDTFDSKIPGCTNVILYYGSSVYNTAQMSRLLDLIIQDCKTFGIQTETPSEIAKLKSMWGE
jgi:hypothetical protein